MEGWIDVGGKLTVEGDQRGITRLHEQGKKAELTLCDGDAWARL